MSRLKRIGLAALMVVAGLNVWTGSPLLALWVGSRVQGDGPLTMSAVFVVVVVFAATSLTMAWVLSQLGAVYDRITGQPATVAQHAPWLRSMRGERERLSRRSRAPDRDGAHPGRHGRDRFRRLRDLVLLLLDVPDRQPVGPRGTPGGCH
jgi:hypothetical protein